MTETGLVCPVCGWEQPPDSPFNERYVLLTDEDLETNNWAGAVKERTIIALCSVDTWSKLKNFHGYLNDEKRDDIDAIWDEKDIESFPSVHVIAGPQNLFIEDFYEIE